MTKNKNSTRYFSTKQEDRVADILGGSRNANSGASEFSKGDVIVKDASLLCECKTVTSDKEQFSIKKEWLTKNISERKAMRLENSCVAISFGPEQENYFIIDEKTMKFLMESLRNFYKS